MSPRKILIEAIAVIAGAVIGLIVFDVVGWLFAGTGFLALISSVPRIVVAVIAIVAFAFYYNTMPATPAAIASLFTGIALPALVERFAFGSILSWGMLLFLFAVFALVALFTYRFVHANGTVRAVADEATSPDARRR